MCRSLEFGAPLLFDQERPKEAGAECNSPSIGVVFESGKWKVTRGYSKRNEWPVFPTGAAAAAATGRKRFQDGSHQRYGLAEVPGASRRRSAGALRTRVAKRVVIAAALRIFYFIL